MTGQDRMSPAFRGEWPAPDDEPRRSGAACAGLAAMKALPLFRPQGFRGSTTHGIERSTAS